MSAGKYLIKIPLQEGHSWPPLHRWSCPQWWPWWSLQSGTWVWFLLEVSCWCPELPWSLEHVAGPGTSNRTSTAIKNMNYKLSFSNMTKNTGFSRIYLRPAFPIFDRSLVHSIQFGSARVPHFNRSELPAPAPAQAARQLGVRPHELQQAVQLLHRY